MMPERCDIYDKNRRPVGRTVARSTPLGEDEYRLVVSVWLKNSRGQWLITRRAEGKSQPLKWEPPGGCVQAGETTLDAALREVREEVGIPLNAESGRLFASFRRNLPCWENPGFLDIWVFPCDFPEEDMVLQQEEVCQAKWADTQEILALIERGEFVPTQEFPYHRQLFSAFREGSCRSKNIMRAIAALAPGKLAEVTLPIPEPDDYEALVWNEGCSFCNTTDRMIVDQLFHTPAYPVLIGHESFGTVIRVGKKVRKYRLGDRVICANAAVRGFNGGFYSSWGGFAEYGIIGDLDAYLADYGALDEANKYRARYAAHQVIPSDLPVEAACLAFPLAEAASSVRQAGDLHGKTVVVIGTGTVGYLFTFFSRMFGAERVVTLGRRESRLITARELGAHHTFVDVEKASDFLTRTGGADVVFECSGNWQALEKGLPYLRQGGMLAVYAVPEKPYSIDLLACPGRFEFRRVHPQVDTALQEVCALLREGRVPVRTLLTHIWPFEQAVSAFEQVRRGDVIKGLLLMPRAFREADDQHHK